MQQIPKHKIVFLGPLFTAKKYCHVLHPTIYVRYLGRLRPFSSPTLRKNNPTTNRLRTTPGPSVSAFSWCRRSGRDALPLVRRRVVGSLPSTDRYSIGIADRRQLPKQTKSPSFADLSPAGGSITAPSFRRVRAFVPLIGRLDHGPGGGWSSNRSKSPGTTVSRHDSGASKNVYQVAGIGFKDIGPLMGGRVVPLPVLFRRVPQ